MITIPEFRLRQDVDIQWLIKEKDRISEAFKTVKRVGQATDKDVEDVNSPHLLDWLVNICMGLGIYAEKLTVNDETRKKDTVKRKEIIKRWNKTPNIKALKGKWLDDEWDGEGQQDNRFYQWFIERGLEILEPSNDELPAVYGIHFKGRDYPVVKHDYDKSALSWSQKDIAGANRKILMKMPKGLRQSTLRG